MDDFLVFGDVLCEVRNIDQAELLQAEPGTLGSVMTFQFDGVGTQDFDAAKWISAGDAVTDSDCDALPAVDGSSTSYVINGLASYTFVQETSGMILCYKFLNHAFKLFSSIPIKDSSTSTNTGSSSSSQSSLLSEFDSEREASNSGQFTVNRDIATVSLKLDKNINDIPPGSAAETQFKTSFVSTMARSLGIDPTRVQILELLEGSVIVKFQLLPSENLADPLVHEILQDLTTQLADPQSDLLKSDIITLINSENALTVTMSTPASPAPASMSIQALRYQRYGLFTFVRSVYSVTENTPKLVVPVLRLQGRDSIITLVVQFDPLKQTATYNQDYRLPAAAEDNPSMIFLRFEIDDAVKSIEIEILDGAVKEAHFEYFTMRLTDPGTPGTALGATPEVVVRLYDYGDGNELKWSVVGNGKNVLRADGNGIFSVDAVFGEDEYDEKCDRVSPTGECAYVCDVGGGLSLGTSSSTPPASENNVLRLNGDADYVVSQIALNAFPDDAFSASLWVRTTSRSPSACLVSYATISDTMRATPFAICNPSNLELLINSRSSRDGVATFVNVSNGEWHFVLATWNTEDGRVVVYDNGMLAFDGGPYRVGESLDRSGMFIVGGLARSGPLDPCRIAVETNVIDGTSTNPGVECTIERGSGFVGDIQHVHLWSRVLSLTELRKELSWSLQVVSNGLVFGWNFDTTHLLERGRFVNDISTKGQAEKHIGFIHCGAVAASTSSSCLVNNVLPNISPAFPCGQVYSNIWHFVAPPELLVQFRKVYGGRLQYQMFAPSVNGSPRPRRGQLSLFDDAGNHISLALGTFPLPSATEWTSYAVVLREDFGSIKEPSGSPVAATEFQQILASAAALWIRGDLWGYDSSGQGQEVVYLNNVAVIQHTVGRIMLDAATPSSRSHAEHRFTVSWMPERAEKPFGFCLKAGCGPNSHDVVHLSHYSLGKSHLMGWIRATAIAAKERDAMRAIWFQ
ncbi:Concanavalin a-like lectin/glucanase, subgroup, partial [Globisporangium splendens]